MKKSIAALVLLLLAGSGCGGASNDLNETDATRGMSVVTTAMSQGMVEVSTAEQPTGGTEVTMTGNQSCLGGGSIAMNGSMRVSEQSFAFSLDMVLEGCRTGNITADGALSFAGSFSEASIAASMTGEISFSGEISGTCDMNIRTEATPDGAMVSVQGNFCGHNVASLTGAITQ